jgi:hypothetical protein
MLKPFYNEQQVTVDDLILRLVLDFRSIDAAEGLLQRPWDSILVEINGPRPMHGTVGRVLWALLREHHPEINLDEAASLMYGDAAVQLGVAIRALLDAAFNAAEEKPKDENPRKPRGASKRSGKTGAPQG